MSNLSDIGFPVSGDQDVNEMIQSVLPFVKSSSCPQGIYYIFTDESGAEIYLQSNLQQELVGFNPHFAGKSRRLIGLTAAVERESSELDGGFHAWANPSDKESPETAGDYPFVFDVPDFRAIEQFEFPKTVEIQLTAFASNDFKIYESEKDYLDSQEAEPQFAAKSFVPAGLFEAAENTPPRPVGFLTGEIKDFELKTNRLSKKQFYWFLIDTFGGETDVVADPKLIPNEPQTGGIVQGHFWLSGKVIN